MGWWSVIEASDDFDDDTTWPEDTDDYLRMPDWWRDVWPEDDRATWEREVGLRACRRCKQQDVLDPLRHCSRCRIELRRCVWCGLDRSTYREARACRTCYRWIQRNAPNTGIKSASRTLLANAFVRHAKARNSRSRQ